ncbi:hypothetical protein PMG71_14360 [Roseofilum sp. BLCC_M154]|uniref:Uncharacterized protein n=1 Tax=Roseofilum acuticapitatum BLCC-M154 TaxID=3022444 RepID=A0ABT7AUM6_9CYAN|nr:hypothetical protein [Roseofilum acuticapitatum]MDJ1170611.1 hypothetical protein [Roseofilum acuticapitatum BLCC-M154]
MSEPHNKLSSVESVLLKSLSLVGVVVFTGIMVGRWNHLVAQAVAETKVAEVVTPEPQADEAEEVIVASASTTTTATPVVMTETAETSETMTETAKTSEAMTETAETSEAMTETAETEVQADAQPATAMKEATVSEQRSELYEQIDSTWQTQPTFSESLVYQVEINKAGEISKYTPLNSAASDYLNETPLENLRKAEASSGSSPFLVVMAPTGILEVSPWTGN